nr:copia protein [Tanacetum cinerariifolium]
MKVKESLNVTFDESPCPTKLSPLVDDVGEEEAIENKTKAVNNDNEEDESVEVDEVINIKESKNHPLEQVIVSLPMSQTVIGTKCVFRNKLDEHGIMSRNKARFVAQGYNQQQGIDYDETYASIASDYGLSILAGSIPERNRLYNRIEPADLQKKSAKPIFGGKQFIQNAYYKKQCDQGTKVLDGGSDDINGGIVVVEEVVKWRGGGISGEVVVKGERTLFRTFCAFWIASSILLLERLIGERMIQNPWVLVEGVFGRGLEREFMIVDWNFLVVDHSRKLSRDVECWFHKDKLLYLGIRENIIWNMRNLLVKEFEECER